MSRLACAILALVGFVALLVVQFNVPWANQHASGFGGSADQTARTWGKSDSGSAFFGSYSGSTYQGWYDGGWSDSDKNAVNQLQVAAPLVVAGTVLLLIGAILSFGPGPAGPIVALVGGLCAVGGTVLYFLAIQDLFNNNQAWQTGFYLAIIGSVLGLVGGVVGMAMGNRRTMTT